MVVLQESVEFLQHDDITRQLHVSHFRACATLLIEEDTFEPDLHVTSVYVLADKAYCIGRSVVSKFSIWTHSQEWQVEPHNHVVALPERWPRSAELR